MDYVAKHGYHAYKDAMIVGPLYKTHIDTKFSYDFANFFHPYVGKLVEVLNRGSVADMLAPATQALSEDFFASEYTAHNSAVVSVTGHPKNIDVAEGGPYANYNWELYFHIPLTIAVHLSKTGRYAEAQRWFHLVFDPTCNDTTVDPPGRYWKFLRFRSQDAQYSIAELLGLLQIPDNQAIPDQLRLKKLVLDGYEAIRHKPFHPHAVARTRPLAYQYQTVMKYLDNLIAWGDSLFAQDTVESINEATGRYVLAANLLGPRPQPIPSSGTVRSRSFTQLKAAGLDATGNALVALEGQLPFNLAAPQNPGTGAPEALGTLFGIGRTLYFCVPANTKLLGYWDTVGDRLFKIRHCMNIQGVVRQLALFDPPLDPGMLVKAAAAGIDIGSIVAGTNQPVGPLKALPLIGKANELANEVKSLGGALLAALERGDSEHLALLRQGHERKIHELAQESRFLSWQAARSNTETLLRARANSYEKYRYYLRMLGQAPDGQLVPENLPLDRRNLDEASFDEAYAALVAQYDRELPIMSLPALKLAAGSSPAAQSGASGSGELYLTGSEQGEMDGLALARDSRLAASIAEIIASVLTFIPEFNVNLHFWGMGASSKVFGGSKLSDAVKIGSEVLKTIATYATEQAGITGKTAAHERRADDWKLQANLAARELMHSGRQILGSLLAEQVARHEYETVQAQIANSIEVEAFLNSKFTNEELHNWMSGELSRLYYQWYRFAADVARRAERTMKLQLRRPELDTVDFVAYNHWDAGRKGLLAGESLAMDVRRMELAYHDNNRRELELTRHVSLRQLDPLALLALKATGKASFLVPEWLFDRDYPGHYLRRIKSVALSVPSVVGPYTPLPATLSLTRSTIRVSPLLADDVYARAEDGEDDRFVDVFGPVEQIATSTGSNDSGMFEANLHDDRFLPFEGAGAHSWWTVELPTELRSFDYSTITDVILHMRYTARVAGAVLGDAATTELQTAMAEAGTSGMALLLSMRYDFPTQWSAFVKGNADLAVELSRGYFPYLAAGRDISVGSMTLYAGTRKLVSRTVPVPMTLSDDLNAGDDPVSLTFPSDPTVLKRTIPDAYLVVRYGLE